MLKLVSIISLLVILAAGILGVGCSQSPPPASGQTFGEYAQQGQTVFTSRCAGCHGSTGEGVTGPAIIGTSAFLGKYNTAQGLLDYISTNMPASAPGSLSRQEYLNVLSHLLVQNNYVSADTTFNENQLSNLSLK